MSAITAEYFQCPSQPRVSQHASWRLSRLLAETHTPHAEIQIWSLQLWMLGVHAAFKWELSDRFKSRTARFTWLGLPPRGFVRFANLCSVFFSFKAWLGSSFLVLLGKHSIIIFQHIEIGVAWEKTRLLHLLLGSSLSRKTLANHRSFQRQRERSYWLFYKCRCTCTSLRWKFC